MKLIFLLFGGLIFSALFIFCINEYQQTDKEKFYNFDTNTYYLNDKKIQ